MIQEIVDREVNNWDNYPGWTTYGISWDLTIERADGTNEYFNQRSIVRWMEDVVQNYNFYDGTL